MVVQQLLHRQQVFEASDGKWHSNILDNRYWGTISPMMQALHDVFGDPQTYTLFVGSIRYNDGVSLVRANCGRRGATYGITNCNLLVLGGSRECLGKFRVYGG